MHLYFQKKVIIGFVVAMAIIIWLATYSSINNEKFSIASQRSSNTNQVLYHAEQLLSHSINLDYGQKGYTITGNIEFLEPSANAAHSIHTHLEELRELTNDKGSLGTILGLALVFYLLIINLKARVQVEASLRLTSARLPDLYDNVPCCSHFVRKDGYFENIFHMDYVVRISF